MSLPSITVAQALGVCCATYLVSAVVRHIRAKDPYATLPTPEGGSWLLGVLVLLIPPEKHLTAHRPLAMCHEQ
jgi:hypothetical protein